MANNKPPGYYWIRLNHDPFWQIAELSKSGIWYLIGNENLFHDNEIQESGKWPIVMPATPLSIEQKIDAITKWLEETKHMNAQDKYNRMPTFK